MTSQPLPRQGASRFDCPECDSELIVRIITGRPFRGRCRDTWKCTDCQHQWEVIRHG